MGRNLSVGGSETLNKISTGKTYDAAELSFKFKTENDSMYFNYMFASDEYPEFVHKGVNDIFAFFIEDLTTGNIKNLAIIDGKLPVNVDNVNSVRNSDLFIENELWESGNIEKWKNDPGRGELSLTYEYDGFTTLLSTGYKVVPGRSYRITFTIADVGDGLYDSAVFLEAGSFSTISQLANSTLLELKEELATDLSSDNEINEGNSSVVLTMRVNFEFDKYEIIADSAIESLNKVSRILKVHPGVYVRIIGHTDNYGSEEYNMNLSNKRAESAMTYLISSGIETDRIKIEGKGDNVPVADNTTNVGRFKNRRLEFEFYIP